MSAPAASIPSPIELTDNAAAKIRGLMAEEGKDELMLRVFIQGGGCSGFEYGFSVEERAAEDDTIIENGGVKLLVDPLSYQYLLGASVDFKQDLQGARFVVHNPNATTTCGCGSSFGI